MKFCPFKNSTNDGFTLIELLVVVIILGVLAAVGLPNFINQIGKARELEAKNNLGAIARAQQAYHFEKQIFASTLNKLNMDINSNSKYYNFPSASVATDLIAKHQATAKNPTADQVKNYAIGVYYDAGLFDISFCQAIDVNQAVDVANTPSGNCTNNGIKLE
jgi:type IV pilus assembly protein PilA